MPFASKSRAPRRTVSDVWQGLAGNLEVIADLSRQGARAARSHDARALANLMIRLKDAICAAIRLHNTNKDLEDGVS
jgi:hypothetical protein